MSELQQIEDQLLPDEGEASEGFIIDSQERAEWAVRKIARAEARIAVRAAVATKLISEIALRLDAITKADKQTVEYLTSLLEPYGAVEIAKQGKRKSLKLLGGEIGFRQSPESLVVTDEAAAVAWLKAIPGARDCIRVKEEVRKTETKQFIHDSGEVPDGCELRQGETRFYVKAGPEAIEGKEAKLE
ncbi:MAG: host-nuclease inhibitor Gam family protein [Acidobacteriia bacterium]|nr:host-nuclease inhibitor Gam family protein [Terriglobia bacterium]